MVCAALVVAPSRPKGGILRATAASLPTLSAALLPKLTCPLCWPAYTAALSALGLNFVDYTPYLFQATLLFLGIVLATLGWQAQRSGRMSALVLGVVAAATVLIGKFAVDSTWITSTGVLLLFAAALFAARRRKNKEVTCPACRGNERIPNS